LIDANHTHEGNGGEYCFFHFVWFGFGFGFLAY